MIVQKRANITRVDHLDYALLYTFSTIPQTLAAAFGVLAAFVLYRLQSDSHRMWEDAQAITQAFGGFAESEFRARLLGEQRYDELLAHCNELLAGPLPEGWGQGSMPKGSAQELAYVRFSTNVASRQAINDALRRAFLVTGITIAGSVVVLTIAHKIIYLPVCLVYVLMFLGVAALLWCLRLYWRLVRAALWGVSRERLKASR